MQILKGPSQTVLDRSRLDEAILIGMDQLSNPGLKSVSQQLSDDFYRGVEQGDGSVFTDSGWPINFWDEGYKGGIDALEANLFRKESRA